MIIPHFDLQPQFKYVNYFIYSILHINNNNNYSFKIFSRFWLVKTTSIIHHNQMLFTKFGKHLRHIESMTSKVERIENYLTNDVKMTSKVQPAADYWTVDRENLGTRLCYPPRPSASVDNTLFDLQNSSYPTQPHSMITNYNNNNTNNNNNNNSYNDNNNKSQPSLKAELL